MMRGHFLLALASLYPSNALSLNEIKSLEDEIADFACTSIFQFLRSRIQRGPRRHDIVHHRDAHAGQVDIATEGTAHVSAPVTRVVVASLPFCVSETSKVERLRPVRRAVMVRSAVGPNVSTWVTLPNAS